MAKAKNEKLNLDHLSVNLGNKSELFNEENDIKESGEVNLEKREKDKVKLKKHETQSLKEMIDLRNSIIKDKSISQVHVNNLSKSILNRLKAVHKHTITSIVDALIISYYVNNMKEIDNEYKKLSKDSII